MRGHSCEARLSYYPDKHDYLFYDLLFTNCVPAAQGARGLAGQYTGREREVTSVGTTQHGSALFLVHLQSFPA
jgi:hypothetical protein